MRLAYVSTDPGVPYGGTKGASVHMTELVRALAAEGAEMLLIVAAVARGAPDPPPGVMLELMPGPGKGTPVADRLAADPARASWLERRFETFGAQAAYERLALHSSAASRAASAVGIPHIVEVNAPLRDEAAAYRTLEAPGAAAAHERAVLGRSALALAVSRPLAEYARAHGATRVRVLPNAVAIERFVAPVRPSGPPVAVFAGTLRPWHGLETTAEAWRMLGDRAPRLLVIGDGRGREVLEAVGAEVTGAMPHDAVPAALARASIGLAPYASGAPAYFSPLKLFEYLAAGLAVIAARLPGVTDVVDGRTALLVPAGDPAALAAAVSALTGDERRRQWMGRNGRELVASKHTWAHRARYVLATAATVPPAPVVSGARP
jgi:glycosyltransferase involved in cell wall biosynthesis